MKELKTTLAKYKLHKDRVLLMLDVKTKNPTNFCCKVKMATFNPGAKSLRKYKISKNNTSMFFLLAYVPKSKVKQI